MATELGVGYVSIIASTKGMGKSIAADLRKLDPLAEQAGKRMGDSMSEGIGQGFQGAEQGAEKAAQGTVSAFSTVGQRIKAGLGGDFKTAFQGVESDAASSANDVAQEFSAAGDKAADGFSSKLMDGLKGLGGLAGVAGIGASVAMGITGGMEREKLGDKLAAQLNLAGPEAEKAGTVAGNLYAGAWGDSMSETHDAVQAVMSSLPGMMDAPAEALEGITAKAMDLSAAFDVDINESVGAIGVMMRNGLATDADQAFDLMVGSMQKVPAGFRDELFPAVTEYGKHFAGLGISGADAMGMLVRGAENGVIGVDKVGDAVKVFQIRATDMSKATGGAYDAIGVDMVDVTNRLLAGGETASGAMGDIIHGLQMIEDPAEQAAASIALFGTPLEDLSVNEIPNFLGLLDPAGDSFDDFSGAAERMGDTLNNNTATAFESLKRGVSMGFVDAIGSAAMVMTDLWEAIKPTMNIWGPLVAGIGAVATAVAAWSVVQWAAAAAVNATIWPMTLAVVGIGLLVGAVIMAYNNVGWFRDLVTGAWAWIQSATASLVSWWTTTAFPAIVNAVQWVGDKFTWLYENVVKPVWGWIRGAISNVVTWFTGTIVPNFHKTIGQLGSFFDFLYRNFVGPVMFAIRLAIAAVSSWFQNYALPRWQASLKVLGDAFRWLNDKVVQPVWSWIQDKIAAVSAWFNVKRAEWGARLRILGDAFKALYRSYVKPAFDWIRDKMSSVWSWVSRNVLDPFKSGLGKLSDAFTKAKDGIGRTWDKLKAKVKEPIAFVVNKVINPFIGGYNKINNAWSGTDIDKIPGFRKGGYTGNKGKDEVAGVVHGRENVINAESSAAIERERPGFLSSLNKHGAHALDNPANMAVGSRVHGQGSFTNRQQHAIARTGILNVYGSAPGWDLGGAIRMADAATGVKVKRGPNTGANASSVMAANFPFWWDGIYNEDGSIGLNTARAAGWTTTARRTIAAHEIGHALGMPHAMSWQGGNGAWSIMNYDNMMKHNSFTNADVAALSTIYGGNGKAGVSGGGDDSSILGDMLKKIVSGPLGQLTGMSKGNVFGELGKGLAEKIVDGIIKRAKELFSGKGLTADDLEGKAARVDGVWDAPVGTTHALRPGVSSIYNGTGGTEFFQRVDPASQGGPVELSADDRALLAQIRDAVDIKVDGRSLVTANRSAEAKYARR